MKGHSSISSGGLRWAILLFASRIWWRFGSHRGEVYPAYSSLRADPLGAMAFYESLESIPGISARRDFSDSNRLPEEPQTVYLHLASPRYEWN